MTKKLEINFTKKPEIVFQFDQFLNVEQAVDKFLNKKENLKKLIAPLIPTNLEETIQKLIPEVSDGYTPQKGVDYDDGKDGETPSDEKIISLIKPQIPKVIPGKDGTTPKKGIDYFTKKELDEIKKELKTTILSEMPEHATKEEVNIKITEVLDKIRKLPTGGGGAQFLRQLMDVNVGNPTAQQYGLTYNPSRGEFALTAITGGGGAVDSVNGQTGVVVLDTSDIAEATDLNYVTDAQLVVIGNTSGTNTGDVTVSDSSEIDLTLTGQQISASIVASSIDETKLDASVNASLDLADTAVQPAGLSGYELLSNKATDFTTVNNTLYPTVQAVNTAINTAVTGLLDYRGSYDASTNLFPATGGSGLLGAILSGDFWICSVAGTLGGTPVTNGDLIIAIVDTPGQTASNWDLIENTLGYTPENVANKVISISGASTDTQYPSAKLLFDQLALKQPLDAQLTSVAGLSYASNALKVIRVNAGETDFELATISAGSGDVVGPASATDGVPALFNTTTGKLLKNSTPTGTGNPVMDTNPTIVTRINVPEIQATSSAGVDIHNSAGTQVALFGAGGGTGSSLVGTTNVGSASADYHQIAGGTGTITDTATGSSTNININLVPKGTGVVQSNGKTLANLTDGGTFAADISVPDEAYGSGWNGSVEVPTKNAIYDKIETMGGLWSELGTTTLGSAASSISVSIAAKKHLRIVIRVIAKANSTATYLRFNSDSGANYSLRRTRSGSAGGSGAVNEMSLGGSTTGNDEYYTLDVVNQSAYSKFLTGTGVEGNQDASAILVTITDAGVWNNTSAQITTVSIHTSTGNADFGIGSFVTVEGHD